MEQDNKITSQDSVWDHFLQSSVSSATCKHCQIMITCSGSMSTLKTHLENIHKFTFEATSNNNGAIAVSSYENTEEQAYISADESTTVELWEPVPKKRKITDYFQSNRSMEMMITRMVTLDGLSFKVFVNSVDLVYLFKKSGYILPESARAIRSIVLKKGEEAKLKVKETLLKFKKGGHKFSLTVDEWSTSRNRRYINVNLHSHQFNTPGKCINLGLVRILPAATAATCQNLIEERLKYFGVDFEDIVGVTTYEANFMGQIGKVLPVYHQLCYAHALQLAVLDTLYERDEPFEDIVTDDYDVDDESDSDVEDDGIMIISPTTTCRTRLKDSSYKTVIDRIREVVKIFIKSPENEEFLQMHITEEFGQNISLILDRKAKWSSLCDMIGRFIMLYPCIEKALVDVNSDIQFDDSEIQLMKHTHEVLEIIRSVVEVLCQEDATLLTADTALRHMFQKLQDTCMPGFQCLSMDLLAALKKRIGDRYILIQGVLRYLHLPKDVPNEPQLSVFEKPSPEIILPIIRALAADTCMENSVIDEEPPPPKLTFKTFKEELLHKLNAELTPSVRQDSVPLQQKILLEMAVYENGGVRGKFLTNAYQQLLTVKPCSIDTDQAFSTAGNFSRKLRSNLGDATLDTLMFLRLYIQSQKKKSEWNL